MNVPVTSSTNVQINNEHTATIDPKHANIRRGPSRAGQYFVINSNAGEIRRADNGATKSTKILEVRRK